MPKPPPPRPAPVRKPATPGRPKDLAKREAIFEAAKRLFIEHGYEGVSMDQIAAEAGVSKLTVYSHFGDKESLFAAAVKSYCETQLPDALLADVPGMPLRERLLQIGRAFYAMISAPEAIAGHRMLCTPRMAETPLPRLFWEAGPRRVQAAFAALLERRVAARELEIPDIPRAAAQFFTLLKGEPHAQLVFGCGEAPLDAKAVEAHVAASVDLFLRAYARRR
ncbi:TetR/AcrR family transcriptional regulator [Vulcaniibacterium gelatinicum]|uniref:TetR/AcrR family transcriptional regulator n=1 Tax=Vulcaniibacterium gelatinicum TaxID=2598725 RepID=UPI0011CCA496|nr:TetR/AcrR family transcriptional regulator [Vulcaniibacterium gelatinicum]